MPITGAEAYCRLPSGLRRRLLEPAINRLPTLRGSRWKGLVRLMQKMSRSASLSPRERFLMNGTYLDTTDRQSLYTSEYDAEIRTGNSWDLHQERFDRVSEADFLHQMLYMDLKMFMTSLNLNYNDKMSMASSVEIRVPFLSRNLCEYAANHVRPEWKLSGFWRPTTKAILREAMKDVVPECIMQQPKAGFFAPVDTWLANDLQPLIADVLDERQIEQRGIFQPERVRRMIDDHRAGRRNWSMQIWQLLTLELWMRAYLDTNSGSAGRPLGIAV